MNTSKNRRILTSSLPEDMQVFVMQVLDELGEADVPNHLPVRLINITDFPEVLFDMAPCDDRGPLYAEQMIGVPDLPPLVCVASILIDGRHRLHAARREGKTALLTIDLSNWLSEETVPQCLHLGKIASTVAVDDKLIKDKIVSSVRETIQADSVDHGDDPDDDEDDEKGYEFKADRLINNVRKVAIENNVTAEFSHRLNYFGFVVGVELTDLFADTPGNGSGTKVMSALMEQSDLEGLTIFVNPSSSRNKEFYKKFGFDAPSGGLEMVRHPPLPDWFVDDRKSSPKP